MLLLALMSCLRGLSEEKSHLDTGRLGGDTEEPRDSVDPEADDDHDGWTADEDCDDDDPDVNPDAEETCDGQDQDCDGQVDEGATDASDWYQDQDHDGFGEGTPSAGCEQPPDTTDRGGDCDDLDSAVNPDATELCFDGVDNDCDGDIDEEEAGCLTLELSEAVCFDLAAALGEPQTPVSVRVVVLQGVTITCDETSRPAWTTGGLGPGSTVLLENHGLIHGHGGDGACAEQGAGETGGDAIHTTVDLIIDNTGEIFGGGGGGGSGDDPSGGGGGAGGGNGCHGGGNSSGANGGNGATRWETIPGGQGALYDGSVGLGGAVGNPPSPGGGGSGGGAQTFATSSGEGQGGAGGGWGGGGGGGGGIRQDRNMGPGGDAGYAVRVVSGSVSFQSGMNTTQVKGQVQ